MKGKKDRMALAATENANVCTSVRNKYFTVETISPEPIPATGGGALASAGATEGAEYDWRSSADIS
jgi:hypothetical protein